MMLNYQFGEFKQNSILRSGRNDSVSEVENEGSNGKNEEEASESSENKAPYLRAVIDWLVAFIKPKYFAELRTKQQNGYIVWTYTKNLQFILHISFLIQSNTQSPSSLVRKTYKFLQEDLYSQLKACDKATFEQIKQGLIAQNKQKYKALGGYYENSYSQIDSHTLEFEWKKNKIAELKSLKLEDCIRAFEEKFLNTGSERRVIEIAQISQDRVEEEQTIYEEERQEVTSRLKDFEEMEGWKKGDGEFYVNEFKFRRL